MGRGRADRSKVGNVTRTCLRQYVGFCQPKMPLWMRLPNQQTVSGGSHHTLLLVSLSAPWSIIVYMF